MSGQSQAPESGLPDALRAAVERTLATAGRSARAGSAALGADRGSELLDEVARRGRGARDELARRGQEAGAGLSRRGQAARDEMSRRVELLERRLGSIEELLRDQVQSKAKPKG
jgi:hypothetical protein